MAQISALVLPFFGLILLGFVAGKWRKLDEAALGWLNVFIIYVALPALFFRIISKTPVEQLTRFDFVFTSLAATYSMFTIVFVVGRFIRRESIGEATLQGLGTAYGNIGYLGPGLALAAYGEQASLPLALIFAFENLVHFVVAPVFMVFDGHERRAPLTLMKDLARKILLHPFILATIAGFIAATFHIRLPLMIDTMIASLSPAAAPCALFAMGVMLALRPLKQMPSELGYIVPMKLLLLPAVMYIFMNVFGPYPDIWVETAVFLAALPTATNVFVLSQQYGMWQERASAAVLVTTVLSVLTVSGILYLFKSGLLAANFLP